MSNKGCSTRGCIGSLFKLGAGKVISTLIGFLILVVIGVVLYLKFA